MSHLDNVKELIAQGNKEGAIKSLVSALQNNSNDVDTWLLLGEVIDEPSKKRDCYNKALKLSPNNPLALNGLRNLEIPEVVSVENPSAKTHDTQPTYQRESNSKETTEQIQDLRKNFQYDPSAKHAPSFNNAKDDWKGVGTGIGILILGIGGFFGISYILGLMLSSGDSSSDSNPICMGMMCLVLIAVLYIWYSGGKNRSEVINTAIEEQKQASSSSAVSGASSTSQSNIVPCRACQHNVSRTAPSCPNCGELYPGLISKCPYCGSKNILITPKGFSLGKAATGAVIAGPIGVAGGLHGRKDLEVKCLSCPRITTIKSDEIR